MGFNDFGEPDDSVDFDFYLDGAAMRDMIRLKRWVVDACDLIRQQTKKGK